MIGDAWRGLLFATFGVTAACGGRVVTTTLDGTFNGETLDVVSPSFAAYDDPSGAAWLIVTLPNQPGVCGRYEQGAWPAATRLLVLGVERAPTSSAPAPAVQPGSYSVLPNGSGQVSPDGTGLAEYLANDATCSAASTRLVPQGGTITIESVGSTAVSGSFDLIFPTGEHVTGTFDAPSCDAGPPPLGSACK